MPCARMPFGPFLPASRACARSRARDKARLPCLPASLRAGDARTPTYGVNQTRRLYGDSTEILRRFQPARRCAHALRRAPGVSGDSGLPACARAPSFRRAGASFRRARLPGAPACPAGPAFAGRRRASAIRAGGRGSSLPPCPAPRVVPARSLPPRPRGRPRPVCPRGRSARCRSGAASRPHTGPSLPAAVAAGDGAAARPYSRTTYIPISHRVRPIVTRLATFGHLWLRDLRWQPAARPICSI